MYKTVDDVYKYLENSINPFPKYTTGKDPDLYFNIYNFLKYGIINNERIWPAYIKNEKDQ